MELKCKAINILKGSKDTGGKRREGRRKEERKERKGEKKGRDARRERGKEVKSTKRAQDRILKPNCKLAET